MHSFWAMKTTRAGPHRPVPKILRHGGQGRQARQAGFAFVKTIFDRRVAPGSIGIRRARAGWVIARAAAHQQQRFDHHTPLPGGAGCSHCRRKKSTPPIHAADKIRRPHTKKLPAHTVENRIPSGAELIGVKWLNMSRDVNRIFTGSAAIWRPCSPVWTNLAG